MKRSTTGLRARLLLLVLFAVIPAFALIAYTTISQRQQAAETAKNGAMNLVRLADNEHGRLIDSTRQVLLSISQLPAVRELRNATACSQMLAGLQKAYPYYTNIGVATLDGNLFCNSRPFARTINIADRSYFRRTVASRDFGIGDYQIGRVTGEPAINFGYPVFDAAGKFHAVAYVALNLSWLNQLITGIDLPAGSVLFVVDSSGTILTRYPEPAKWVGKSMSNEPLIKLILTQKSGGTAEMPGLDQVQRLYAFAPLHEGTSSNVYVSVGIPNAVAFGAANEVFARNMALLFLVAVLAVIAAWVGSNVFVLRRINALADAARRLAKGDMSARTGLPHGTEELGQLARSFDDMATALQRVNRALKTLSVSNRSVVRATDEQTLVAEMCRIIVEVGGYRFAWIGYAEDNEHKLIRPTAEFGFDGGMEVLSKWMTGVTWADTPLGRGSVGRAVRTAKPYVAGNFPENPDLAPWRDEAIRRGYGSCAAFPLCVKDKPVGVLAIYSAEPDAFDAEELELLDEAARDLAFGITVLRTRTEHDRANATISRMAYYDGLTGLPNHVYFDERLRRTLSETSTGDPSTALYVIGLNRLREINDALGFHQGDVLLKQVGMRIRSVFREEVLVARMRGDEFAVLLAVRDDEETAEIAQKILNALKAPFAISDLSLDVSVAVGISVSPQHGSEATLLLRNADVAMQQAKKSTKGYVFYAPEQDEDGTRRLSLAGELRRAIEGEELVLYYQPKIDMRDSRVCGVEALVRWNHPLRGLIPPDEFIALAEHTGLIKPLTDWVVDAALRQSSAWRKEGLALPIAVNLSARNLHDEELIYQLDQRFAVWRADPEWLEMEITEGAVMQDPDGALDVLRRLSSMGIKLFIDDFGTGYSSLGYLKKLPVDAIKIDKSFVIDMLSDADSAAIVRSTIGLAHDLDKKVVAEGVEGAALWNQLVGLGCDVAQGYFISKPVPAEQFKDWFDRRARSQRLGKQSLS